jgi:hypothetical protein
LLVIEHPSLAQMLKIGFDAVWDEGETFEEAFAKSPSANVTTARVETV